MAAVELLSVLHSFEFDVRWYLVAVAAALVGRRKPVTRRRGSGEAQAGVRQSHGATRARACGPCGRGVTISRRREQGRQGQVGSGAIGGGRTARARAVQGGRDRARAMQGGARARQGVDARAGSRDARLGRGLARCRASTRGRACVMQGRATAAARLRASWGARRRARVGLRCSVGAPTAEQARPQRSGAP